MLQQGDKIIYENLNTRKVMKGTIKSKVGKNLIAIGSHFVSWMDIKDLKIIKIEKKSDNNGIFFK